MAIKTTKPAGKKRGPKFKFACDFCNKKLKTKQGMENHMKNTCKKRMEAQPNDQEKEDIMQDLEQALEQTEFAGSQYVSQQVQQMVRRPVGRPKIIEGILLQKLRFAFILGCTDAEACLLAGISEGTLYNYQADNPEFLEEKEALKNFKKIQARVTVLKNIHLPEMARWYLELKANDEFSRRTINTGEVLHGVMTEERAKRAEEILGQFDPRPKIRVSNDAPGEKPKVEQLT